MTKTEFPHDEALAAAKSVVSRKRHLVTSLRSSPEDVVDDLVSRIWQDWQAGRFNPGKSQFSTWATMTASSDLLDMCKRESTAILKATEYTDELPEPKEEKSGTVNCTDRLATLAGVARGYAAADLVMVSPNIAHLTGLTVSQKVALLVLKADGGLSYAGAAMLLHGSSSVRDAILVERPPSVGAIKRALICARLRPWGRDAYVRKVLAKCLKAMGEPAYAE
jgi:DNA-directed RNA polymerase specialized sigma24 family protein